MIVSGPVLAAIWEGDAAGGEPEVDAVLPVLEGVCRRERIAERTVRVSIESGERSAGRFMRESGAWGAGSVILAKAEI